MEDQAHSPHNTEITSNTNTTNTGNGSSVGGPSLSPSGVGSKDVNAHHHHGYHVLGGYPQEGYDVSRVNVPSSGPRYKLQVEVNSDYKFLTICDPNIQIADLKNQVEIEYTELYPLELPITILRLQDSRRNDMPLRFKISDLLKDKDKVYVVIKPIVNPDDENADPNSTPAPRQRGRKRKNQDKDMKSSLDTPNKKQAMNSLSPQSLQQSQSPSSTPQQMMHQQQMQQMSIPYSPGAKVAMPAQNSQQERVACTPYCDLIETRDQVPCTRCGELRPYVVPDSEKSDRNQCSKWCVTGSTRKLKAAGLEFCSICLARHRAGKYDLRKAHQCILCHRPWLHLDEYQYCRTCRKSAMGTEPQLQPQPIMLGSNNIQMISSNGAPMHTMSQQHIQHHPHPQSIPQHLTHQQSPLPPHTRVHSPPHITMHDIHKRTDLDPNKMKEPKTQSIPLQQLHHFQQQSQQLLGVNSPQHHATSSPSNKDDHNKDHLPTDEQHHQTHEHHHHPEAHEEHIVHGDHSHAEHAPEDVHAHHAQDTQQQLDEMVLSQTLPTGQEGEAHGQYVYDTTIPINTQEKVGS